VERDVLVPPRRLAQELVELGADEKMIDEM
jgi:hypothetical protein